MSKVLLFGTGGIGGLYARALCCSPSVELTTVCRSNYDAIATKGIRIDSDVFGQVTVHPDHIVRSCEEATGPFDFVIVTAKVLAGTAEKVNAAVGPETSIVLIQNGIFIEEEYATLYPGRPIVSCSVNAGCTQTEPGMIRHVTRERLFLGAYPMDDPVARHRTEQIARFFKEGGATIFVDEDVQERRWEKVALNCALNPVCALTRLPDSWFFDTGKDLAYSSEQFSRDIMDEVGLIAQAVGYSRETVERSKASLELPLNRNLDDSRSPSMLQDIRNGGRLEVEAILGNPVRKARELDVPVPRLEILYILTKGLDRAIGENM